MVQTRGVCQSLRPPPCLAVQRPRHRVPRWQGLQHSDAVFVLEQADRLEAAAVPGDGGRGPLQARQEQSNNVALRRSQPLFNSGAPPNDRAGRLRHAPNVRAEVHDSALRPDRGKTNAPARTHVGNRAVACARKKLVC